MEVTPMNAHLMDSFPGYRGCSARRASTRGSLHWSRNLKTMRGNWSVNLPHYTILPPTGSCQVPGKVSLARRFHSRFYL